MKKLLSILTLIAILVAVFYTVPVKAAETSHYNRLVTISKDGNWGYVYLCEYIDGDCQDDSCEEDIAIVDYRGNEAEVVIPESVDGHTVLGVGDFYDESYPEDELVSKLFADDFNVTKVTLPKTLQKFGKYIYGEFGGDEEGWYEKNAFYTAHSSFYKDTITEYIVDENSPYLSSENGIIYNKDKTELLLYPQGKTDEVFTLPESVKSFGAYAFAYSKLKRVENFNHIRELSYGLFMNSSLEEFPKMENIQEIAPYAFAYCNNLKSVTIPLRVNDIYDHAFYYCKNIKEVDFGKIIYIGSAAFAQCSSLKEAILPETCRMLQDYAFSNCQKLELLTTNYLEFIGSYAFNKCYSLRLIHESIDNVGDPEIGYENPYNVLTAEKIECNAFKNCTSIKYLDIRDAEEIQENAFLNCTALSEVHFWFDIPKDIHANAFENTALVNNHKGGIIYIDDLALCYKKPAKAATTIKIKSGTKHIASWCLYKIDGVKSLYLPSSLKEVEEVNISSMKDLKRVYISGKKTEFDNNSCQNNYRSKTTYYIKSKAYRVIEHFDKDHYTYTTDWKPDKTKSVSAVGKTKSTAKITWKKQGYVSGYEVYMKTSKNGKWKKVATLKGSDSTSYTKKSLSKNKTYYFRVRAYKTVESSTYYGAYSSTDAAKTKSR